MPQRRGLRQLASGVHITFVIVFDEDHLVIPERRADRGTHPDIHAAVTADHHKGRIFHLRQLAPPGPLTKYLLLDYPHHLGINNIRIV